MADSGFNRGSMPLENKCKWEISAIVEILESKGLCTKQDFHDRVAELSKNDRPVKRVRELEDQIERIEGLRVKITDSSTNKRYPDTRELPSYPYKRAPANMTVNEWIKDRFAKAYPGSNVTIYFNEFRITGDETLRDLRNFYKDRDDE